jgi:hypothetical protein
LSNYNVQSVRKIFLSSIFQTLDDLLFIIDL